MKIYSIYDSKAEAFIQPFFSPNKATALRSFTQAAQDEKTQYFTHGADYTLFEIGSWDEQKGLVTPAEANMNLGTALEHKGETYDRTETPPTPITSGRREQG